jgi:hypothetical protein
VNVVHWPNDTPGYALPLHFVEEVVCRVTTLEHSDKEEAECVHGEDDGTDDDDLTLPLFQYLVPESARPVRARAQELTIRKKNTANESFSAKLVNM